ncbi:MAG: M23 family metallopeptidase [Defluviitaleaceae bacterium]|nr:M23 family metallopeptidase [Defluviitaleaceae bacterium]
MDRVHYRRVTPSRLNTANTRAESIEEPTISETVILQCIVSGILIICILLISFVDIEPTFAMREGLRQILAGAETPQELFLDFRELNENFLGWGPAPQELEIQEIESLPDTVSEPPPINELPLITPELSSFVMPEPEPLSPTPTWIPPAEGRISSPSGRRVNPVTGRNEFHDGIDIAIPSGTPIIAPKDGEIIAAGFCAGYGNFMRLSHENGYITFYAHLSRTLSQIGETVTQGTQIAYSGNTGQSTGPHLHFGIFQNNQFVDPLSRVTP